MKRFSIVRYWRLLRTSLKVDKRAHTVFAMILTGLFYGFFMFYNWLVTGTVAGMSEEEMMVDLGMYGFLKIMILLGIIAVVVGFCSAHSVHFLGRSNSAYAELMKPATEAERFAVVVTRSFLIAVIDSFIAFAIADSIEWLTTGNVPVDYYREIDWQYVKETNSLPAGLEALMKKSIAASTVTILFCSSWFMLCATLFSRHPFIFGMLLLWVMVQFVSIGLFFVVGIATDYSLVQEVGFDGRAVVRSMSTYVDCVIVITSVATAMFWTISYKRMKKLATAKYE